MNTPTPHTFETWCATVVDCMRADERADLFREAVAYAEEEDNRILLPGITGRELLEFLRSDEPKDAFDNGYEQPDKYANFLLTEWDLFGPRGE